MKLIIIISGAPCFHILLQLIVFLSSNSLTTCSQLEVIPRYSNQTDHLSLNSLKEHLTDGINGRSLESWNDSVHFCDWQGVTCSQRHQRVISLKFDGEFLGGYLHSSIGNLTFLKYIKFYKTGLTGTLPEEIGQLYRLRYLNLSRNYLEGRIPDDLANCSSLRMVILNYNNFTGRLPVQFGLMSQLTQLWLAENRLEGGVPSFLGNLTNLIALQLSENGLGGSIPSELGRLKALKLLQLDGNNLSGTVPLELSNLTNVAEISLSVNNLTGNIMDSLGVNFPRLRWLILGLNRFTGGIPKTVANLSSLGLFDISSNLMTGRIPGNLGSLQALYMLNCQENHFGNGESDDLDFLTSLTNVSSLNILSFYGNNFGGSLPISVANLSNQLTTLSLGSNRISGNIPEKIGNLISLTQLGFENNILTGVIPSSIGQLRNLELLSFGGNKLSGAIPSGFGNLTSIFSLDLSINNLTGEIPTTFRNFGKMQTLYLQKNKLNGTIPNNVIGSMNQLIGLDLSKNLLEGYFPADVGELRNLREVDVSDNKLSGKIPVELGNCVGLEFLSLSGNHFQGSIPTSLGTLKAMQQLDLSDNNLTGGIPLELGSLAILRSLNLSFNDLSGQVPTDGVFKNTSAVELTGNLRLCGGIPQLRLPSCKANSRQLLSIRNIVIISVTCGVFFLALVLSGILLFRRKAHTKQSEVPSSNSLEEVHQRMSYKELFDATDGFSPSNLIGKGSFGSVFRGKLKGNNQQVAVKVLNLQKSGAFKSFVTECNALKEIRHRHLVKIITSCSSIDFKGNEFMALVYELMPNGSLETWVHGSMNLNLNQRLTIALDVALALDYLHHQCEIQVVHCDLKPSNILLDQDMVAHVGDFGLAKLLTEYTEISKNEQSYSSAIKGTVGYVAPGNLK